MLPPIPTARRAIPTTDAIAIRIALIGAMAQLATPASAQGTHVYRNTGSPSASIRDFEFADITSRFLRLWDSAGAPIAIVQYSLTYRNVFDVHQDQAVTLALTLRQMGNGERVRDTSWQQDLSAAKAPADRTATGHLVVPLVPGLNSWSLTAGPGNWRLGDTVSQVALPAGPGIVVSDLVLSGPESATTWHFADQAVLLSLSDVFGRKVPLHVAYQVRSDASHGETRTSLTVTDISDSTNGKRVLQISFPGRLGAGVSLVERTIDLSRLKPGRFLLELQVGDLHGGGASVRSAEFTLK